jgi:hypothetical protein
MCFDAETSLHDVRDVQAIHPSPIAGVAHA